jgi:hypothetical protein
VAPSSGVYGSTRWLLALEAALLPASECESAESGILESAFELSRAWKGKRGIEGGTIDGGWSLSSGGGLGGSGLSAMNGVPARLGISDCLPNKFSVGCVRSASRAASTSGHASSVTRFVASTRYCNAVSHELWRASSGAVILMTFDGATTTIE